MTLDAHNVEVSQHRSPASATGDRASIQLRAPGTVAVQPTPTGNPFPPVDQGKPF